MFKAVAKRSGSIRSTTHKRYTLNKLLQGATPKNIKELNKKTKWAREGKPTGRELT